MTKPTAQSPCTDTPPCDSNKLTKQLTAVVLGLLVFFDFAYTQRFSRQYLGDIQHQDPRVMTVVDNEDTILQALANQLSQQAQELEKELKETRESKQQLRGNEKGGAAKDISDDNAKPSCISLMQENPQYRDGAFLTNHSIPISWRDRADGSRELHHSACHLHRYTSEQAKQCLNGKHTNFIGDSLSRYQFMSLVWLLHKGSYPPHFVNNGRSPCTHLDENGNATCSPPDEPNNCWDRTWDSTQNKSFFEVKIQASGSWLYEGHMEANAMKTRKSKHFQIVDNFFYASPVDNPDPATLPMAQHRPRSNQLFLSYVSEFGWDINPVTMFEWTGCALQGNCTHSDELLATRRERALNQDTDYSQDLAVALKEILPQLLPPVDIQVYNRGIWGTLTKERINLLMPLLYQYSHRGRDGESNGRCFFRSTTQVTREKKRKERSYVRNATMQAGCEYMDYAHLLQPFNELTEEETKENIKMDGVHFKPWVYEELNNMFLNVLCNADIKLSS